MTHFHDDSKPEPPKTTVRPIRSEIRLETRELMDTYAALKFAHIIMTDMLSEAGSDPAMSAEDVLALHNRMGVIEKLMTKYASILSEVPGALRFIDFITKWHF
jgi:hypothetical protein